MTLVGIAFLGAATLALAYGAFAWRAPDGRGASALLWAMVLGVTSVTWGRTGSDSLMGGEVVEPLALWLVGIGLVVCVFITAQGLLEHRKAWRMLRTTPQHIGEVRVEWSGFDESCTALGLFLLLGVFAQLSMGMTTEWCDERLLAAVLGVTAFATGVALLRLVTRRWRIELGDIGVSLLSVGFATLLLTFLPADPPALSDRIPTRFNTILVGLTVMIWLWSWLYDVWEQQLDAGEAWTTSGRLRSRIPRLIVAITIVCLIVGGMMSFWPRLPMIGTNDDSFMRMGFGIAGHLFLILALVTLARRWKHVPLAVFAGLAALNLGAFLLVRLAMLSEIEA